MTIDEHNNNNYSSSVVPSAPTEDELYRVDNNDPEAVVVQAEPVYPGQHYSPSGNDDIPFVHATSVSVTSSSDHQYHHPGSSYATTNYSGSIATATGPPQPPSSPFATVTGPPRSPTNNSSCIAPNTTTPGVSVVTHTPVVQQQQQQQQHVHVYNNNNTSRYRNSNGTLTCCGVCLIVWISICVCCLSPFLIAIIVWGASSQYMTVDNVVDGFDDDFWNTTYTDDFHNNDP
jgi:hypothetical protein